MNVGFDYFQTVTEHPMELADIARALTRDGHNVFVISAINKTADVAGSKLLVQEFLTAANFPPVLIEMVEFTYSEQVPKLKLEKCIKHKIRLFLDDREDVCRLLKLHGIASFKSTMLKGRKGLPPI